MADFGKLSRLLGRDFGCDIALASDELVDGVHRRYRIEPTGAAPIELTISKAGDDGVTTRALLAIVEHQTLSRIMGPFSSLRDNAVLGAVRGVSDRLDALIAEGQALLALLDQALQDDAAQ